MSRQDNAETVEVDPRVWNALVEMLDNKTGEITVGFSGGAITRVETLQTIPQRATLSSAANGNNTNRRFTKL